MKRVLCSCLIAGVSSLVAAQDYPTKAVRFVVPFPPGGGTDTLARIVGQNLSKTLGQSIVLDNRIKERRLFDVPACKHRLIGDVKEVVVTSSLEFAY